MNNVGYTAGTAELHWCMDFMMKFGLVGAFSKAETNLSTIKGD